MNGHHNDADEGANPGLSSEGLPSTRGQNPGEGSAELAAILEAYLADLEAGRSPDRSGILARHPHLAEPLAEALAGLEFIHRTAPSANRAPVQLGDFRILREVGRGGMGVVYEAEQVSLKRRVALKVLRFGPVADEVAMQRFQREAETVGRLHHTNIVPIFAVGAEEGVRYFAMQFIEGRDLGRVAREMRGAQEAIDFARVAEWGLQASEALAHAHQRGVIHRDIKPSNLILDAENRIWLTDFGLARRQDDSSLSLTGALLGTPRYMSPEQAAASRTPVDHRTDLYSLGATLYELVTGQPIFEAASPHEVISQILHAQPRAPRALTPDLPRDLETIILKCLAKEATSRYASARVLNEDLRAFLDGRPIAARRPRVLERSVRWIRQHRRLVATAAISGVLSVGLVAVGWIGWRGYSTARQGRVQFSSTHPGALAEILDPGGEPVVPRFPVPHEAPILVPAGAYQVRLSAPGALSETWPIEVGAGLPLQRSLELTPRSLWPLQDLGAPQALECVPLRGTGTGLLMLLSPESRSGEPALPARLRLLDGATARPVWSADLAFDAATLPGGDLAEWQALLTHWAVPPVFAGTGIGDRATDLDDDGAPDFVLLSRSSASVLAVSGADGRVLWWHRGHPDLPPGTPPHGRWSPRPGQGFVVGSPSVADLDGDGRGDVVVCFRSNGDTYITADGAPRPPVPGNWIAALSGRTGAELWRQSVEADWSDFVSTSTAARHNTLAHPEISRLHGRPAVILAEGGHLRIWDGRTGTPMDPAPSPGFAIGRAPIYFSLTGTNRTHALLFRHLSGNDAQLEMVALDLERRAVPWRSTPLTVLAGVAGELDAIPAEMFIPLDLEGDGGTEISTFTARHPEVERWTFGVQVLDAATGRRRWETVLHDAAHPQSIPSEARLLPGPDIDRDGTRDLFAVLPAYDVPRARHGLLSVALSGATGSVLWRRHHPGLGGARSLAWWHEAPDGWPLLVTTTSPLGGGRTSTLCLLAGSGQVAHTLMDVGDVRLRDLDGDGALDLLHAVRAQNSLRWAAIRGQPGPAWQRLGTWLAGPDVDGDAIGDAYGLSGPTLSARSGRDGRLLWSAGVDSALPGTLWVPPAVRPTTTTPGMDSVVAAVQVPRPPGSSPGLAASRSIAAYSARDGRLRWTAAGLDLGPATRSGSSLGWAYDYPYLEVADLDGDGLTEVLASWVTEAGALRLSVVSGEDGRVRWQAPLVDGAMAPDPRPGGAPIADFNGDGVRDLALILAPEAVGNGTGTGTGSRGAVEPGREGFRVDVLDGRHGRSLWAKPFAWVTDPQHILWPEPTLGDLDGDAVPEVLVVRHRGYSGGRGYACELVVLDGRSGLVRWTWTWDAGFPALWAPLVLTSPDPARRRVALGVGRVERGEFEIVLLDPEGRTALRRVVSVKGHAPDRGGLGWAAVDLDGDATSELVFPSDGALCGGFGPELEVRWRIPLADGGRESFRLLAGAATLGAAVEWVDLVLWTGHDVFGIRGSVGDRVWRCRAPSKPAWGHSGSQHLRLVRLGHGPLGTGLQFLPPLARADFSAVHTVWRTHPDGRYLTAP